jgi:hypothetical protein
MDIDIDLNDIKEKFNGFTLIQCEFQNYYSYVKKPNATNFISDFHNTFVKYDASIQLNILNVDGDILLAHLNPPDKKSEMGLNINKYRKLSLFDIKDDNTIIKTYKRILENYTKLFKPPINDAFFIEKIDNTIRKLSSTYYENYIEFIGKWFISVFRPVINAFIIEINEELSKNYGVKLFIAGGDAMRRYDPDISFTKDIDTKLYIKNAKLSESIKVPRSYKSAAESLAMSKEDMDSVKPVIQVRDEGVIKKLIIDTIVKHIVKLRNYLEENFKRLVSDIKYIVYKSDEDYEYLVCLARVPYNKLDYQHFRTREIRKGKDFPVDLYSIDFQTYLIQIKKGDYTNTFINQETNKIDYKSLLDDLDKRLKNRTKTNLENRKILDENFVITALDVSVIDVVLEDDGDYNVADHTDNNIPFASPSFIIKDFHKTYSNPDRALARISSDKYKKDIERYNKMYVFYQQYNEKGIFKIDTKEYISKEIFNNPYVTILPRNRQPQDEFTTIVSHIIEKIKNGHGFSIEHFILMNKIVQKKGDMDKLNPVLKTFLENFAEMKTNLPYENLDQIDDNYISSSHTRSKSNSASNSPSNKDDNDQLMKDDDQKTKQDDNRQIKNKYYKLFYYLVSFKDGLQRHKISFSNKMILTALKHMEETKEIEKKEVIARKKKDAQMKIRSIIARKRKENRQETAREAAARQETAREAAARNNVLQRPAYATTKRQIDIDVTTLLPPKRSRSQRTFHQTQDTQGTIYVPVVPNLLFRNRAF